MTKYEKVYSFNVLDEIANGADVFIIDRAVYCDSRAIRKANNLFVEYVCKIINHENVDNRYEFYKVVNTDE